MLLRAPLTAAEIVNHPEFKHVVWDLQPAKKGKARVAQGRGGPIEISYEIHGNGPTHLVVRYRISYDFSLLSKRTWKRAEWLLDSFLITSPG